MDEVAAGPAENAEVVHWGYRLVLGREPESPALLHGWREYSPRRILDILAASQEAAIWRASGFPAKGDWIHQPLSRDAIGAAHRLLHDAAPSEAEVDAALGGHGSLAAFRQSFLAQVFGREPADAPTAAFGEHRTISFLGRRFTLQGRVGDHYWDTFNAAAPDPGITRLARLARAAWPDGGDGRVLVDAGANLGVTSLALAAGAPRHAALLAVEPDPRSTPLLRANLAGNELTRAVVVETALGATDGSATMRVATSNAAVNYLVGERSYAPEADSSRVEVPLRRLDTVLQQQGLDRVDLLKIDVEGAESEVMKGASEAIRLGRPIIFAEFNLWTQMVVAVRNPLDVLEEWHAAFPAVVVFHGDRPKVLRDRDAILWWLHGLLAERHGIEDIVLCHDLGWVERWA